MKKLSFAAVLILCVRAVLADTLEPSAGTAVQGFFLSYDSGKLNFMNSEKRSVHAIPSSVRRITLDKPLKATLESKMKRGEKADVTLTGFEQGAFLIERGGKAEKVPLQMVSALRVDATANNRTTDQLESASVISKGEEVDLAAVVEQGKVTIIQFHLPGSLTSEHEGNYVASLELQAKGKIVVKRVTVTDVSVPVAKQYQITTLPQFWFYGRDAKLSTKLTDRFTEGDIDAAVKKASK